MGQGRQIIVVMACIMYKPAAAVIAKRQSFEAHINRLCSESEQCGNLVLIVYVKFFMH